MIQTIDKEITHDFSFHLIEAIKYNNWYSGEKIYDYCFSESTIIHTTELIPVGSVEFILDFLKICFKIDDIKPLNIPQELMKIEYLNRRVFHDNEIEDTPFLSSHKFFVKSEDKIKGYKNIITLDNIPKEGSYIISDLVDIQSEWRAFIFNNQLVGLQNYQGDFTLFPDVDLIHKMIYDYKDKNPAYTLDVGINQEGTFLIEIHDFFSCGLYGFSDYMALPRMFIATWNKLIGSK